MRALFDRQTRNLQRAVAVGLAAALGLPPGAGLTMALVRRIRALIVAAAALPVATRTRTDSGVLDASPPDQM